MKSSAFVITTRRPATFLLASLVSLPTMSMTLIAPAVPVLYAEFAISYNQAQLVITAFLMAMAIGLMFVGMLSDRYGRRPVFLTGTGLFFIASVMGFLASHFEFLVIARSLQGLSAAALMITGRIIAHDIYDAKDASRALSSVTAIQTLVPILSLAVGGLVVDNFGWRATLGIMSIFSGMVFIQSLLLIPESNKNPLSSLRFGVMSAAYQAVLSARSWQLYSLCAGMQIGMFYSMNGYMPYHFARLGASISEFGFYYATISGGYLIGNMVNRHFGARLSLGQWVLLGSWITLVILALIWGLDKAGMLSPILLSGLLCVIGFSHGLLVANAIISSLSGTGQHSGTASGLGSAAHMMIGALSGSLIISLGGATSFWICLCVNALMAAASVWAAFAALKQAR